MPGIISVGSGPGRRHSAGYGLRLPPYLVVRPATLADVSAIFDLVAACDLADLGEVDYEEGDVVEELTRRRVDLDRDCWVVAHGERLVGTASVLDRIGSPAADGDLVVRPDADPAVGRTSWSCSRLEARAAEQARRRRASASRSPWPTPRRTRTGPGTWPPRATPPYAGSPDGRRPRGGPAGPAAGAARMAVADLTGGDLRGVVLGPNMTTLTFALAGALAKTLLGRR